MKPQVRILPPEEQAAWPEDLVRSAAFAGLDPWMKFVETVYGYRAYRLAAEAAGTVTGMLALAHIRHPLFGSFLATAPFASYGGFAFASSEACAALLERSRVLADELGVKYLNVRSGGGELTAPSGWEQHPVYATYRAELDLPAEKLLAGYSSNHRNHIRKSLRKGFGIRFGRLELLDETYRALARSMHELGSPYHSRAYLRAMAEALGDALQFVVLYAPGGQLAGAGVFIAYRDVVTNLHANVLRRFRSEYAGEYLYWSTIQHYCEGGFRVFDMGRSLIGSGNEAFKMKWNPRKQVLAYWYALRAGAALPELNQKNPKFRLAIWAWKRLPEFVAQALGPALIRGLA